MDFNDPEARAIFFELHSGLPREGPGSRDCTARALALCGALPFQPEVLDIACGPGMQTLDLARLLPDATITAIDNHAPFVAEAKRRVAAARLGDRVTAELGDMTALAFPTGRFDLIWCEGAAYIMGVAEALQAWRPLLKAGGRLALSEAIWLREDPPEEVRRCWAEAYPAMGDIESCRALVRAAGYRLLGDFLLPEEAWWQDYYGPKGQRLEKLAAQYADDPIARAVLQEAAEEMDLHRRFAATYGYVFLVMQRATSRRVGPSNQLGGAVREGISV